MLKLEYSYIFIKEVFLRKFIFLISLACIGTSAIASDFRFGQGQFSIESKIFGTTEKVKEDVTTYSLAEEHANFLKTNIFYGYDITWISSRKEEKYLNLYNTSVETLPLPSGYKPLMKYELQGLDAQIDLGYDIINKDKKKTYLSLGGIFGISVPYVKGYNNKNNSNDTKSYLPDSKTKISTYRLGITLRGAYTIFKRFSMFTSVTYAYQTGKVKNEYWGIDTTAAGNYMNFTAGIKFYLFEYEKKIWKITLSPRLYLTAGYKYDYWILKDVKVNNIALNINKDNLKIKNQVGFLGIGYSF